MGGVQVVEGSHGQAKVVRFGRGDNLLFMDLMMDHNVEPGT